MAASDKKSFLLRLSPEMLVRLQKWANDDFRSLNGQIEFLLHEALKKAGRLKIENSEKRSSEE